MATYETTASRGRTIAALFACLGLMWGFGSVVLTDAAGWEPLAAPASTVLLLAAFGWLCRGREITGVIGQASAVSYAVYAGLALARLSEPGTVEASVIAPFVAPLPVVLLAGLPFALIFTVFVALPVALIPLRGPFGRAADARFWTFVAEQNAARQAAASRGPSRKPA